MVQKFTANCEGAQYLLQQFKLFHQDNSKGINYNLTKPKEILVVYSAHPTFHQYSSKTFPTNFKLQAKNFNLLIIKRSGRRTQGKNTLSCKTKIIHNENKNLPFTFFLFIIVLLLLPRRRRTRKISNTRKKQKWNHLETGVSFAKPNSTKTTAAHIATNSATQSFNQHIIKLNPLWFIL